jgi:G3E family GTPase
MTADDRIPVSVITGFLGSGKTTLLNRLLQDPAMAGAAVIINEFGEIGLDHLLIATPNENTVLLSSGCICCTVRGDLVNTLRDLDKQRRAGDLPPFDRVLIETTGLADPVPIVQTVVIDEKLAPAYLLDSVITLVDGVNGLQQLQSQPESMKQAAVADRLLITKTDLADASAVAALQERLGLINPGAELRHLVRGEIPASALFGAVIAPQSRATDLARWLREGEYRKVEARQGLQPAAAHGEDIRSYSIAFDSPVTRAGLTAWLTAVASLRGAELLRVKGLLNIDGEPVAVHAVQTLIHEPVTLQQWPDAERRSRLVFITRGMDRAAIESTLDVLGWRSTAPAAGVPKPDPQTYAKFLAAMTRMR